MQINDFSKKKFFLDHKLSRRTEMAQNGKKACTQSILETGGDMIAALWMYGGIQLLPPFWAAINQNHDYKFLQTTFFLRRKNVQIRIFIFNSMDIFSKKVLTRPSQNSGFQGLFCLWLYVFGPSTCFREMLQKKMLCLMTFLW